MAKTAKLTATITRGFSFVEVGIPTVLEMRVSGATASERTVRYRKGQRMSFGAWREFRAFADLASEHGGEVMFC